MVRPKTYTSRTVMLRPESALVAPWMWLSMGTSLEIGGAQGVQRQFKAELVWGKSTETCHLRRCVESHTQK